ncbi:MAG: MFS transporter [Actinobacteria bacterium]|uniref:Multidrug efflux pump Tap n=1 Tax=freshwater metagenome TaxID=449393 RepID=A0A6J7P317_9ZZZZ|nr:MFS transporter [Actinomycetota bacterium]
MRIRHSYLLAASAMFASAGNSAVHIAIPWLVLEITGSSANAGVVLGISGFSVIFTAPIIGGLIAILGPRPVSIWADIISAASVVLFPIVGTLLGLNLASLLIIAIAGALFDPAGATARKSLIQAVAERDGLSLTKFNGTYEAAATIGTVIGPTGAALAISFVGINTTFYLIAIVFVLASCLAMFIPVVTSHIRTKEPFSVGNVFRETRIGMNALWRDKPLLSLVGLYTLLTAIYMPVESIVLSRYFRDLNEPRTLGFVLSAMSVGIVIGALQFHRAVRTFSPGNLVIISMTLIGAVVCAMAFLPNAIIFIALGLALGLAFGPVSPMSNYLVQKRMPQHLHGPVFGTQFSLMYLATPAGTLALGLIVQSVSIAPLLFVIGALFIGVTLLVGFTGPLRQLRIEATDHNVTTE